MSNSVDDAIDFDWKPKLGMGFNSENDAYQFYNAYGGKIGFSIRRQLCNKNKVTGEITSRLFVCYKEGKRAKDKRDFMTKKPRQEVRDGCNARLYVKLNRNLGKHVVIEFKEEHNHPLVIPDCFHMLPSQRRISESQGIEVELAEEAGISLGSAYELMGMHASGREALGYTKVDQKNYLKSKRQRTLAYGEAGSILKYFQKRTIDNPSFYHAVQLDSEEQITNIFWADANMIIDYNLFGDVVSFDTTYKINKEHRPFAVFVGFNHHRETVVFGAALMYDETVESFVWLFETFMEAMSNKAPKTIFTDQDAAMSKAISIVLPQTYHRLCVWHLMQNALKHLTSVFKDHEGVRSVLTRFMEHIDDEDQFLEAWESMLDEYDVRENNWLKLTFGVKEKWARPYVKLAWSAGMRSTQLSESFNSNLKDYLRSDHDVVQFFMHFERVLNDKRYKELEAEYALCQKLPRVMCNVRMLIQAGSIYTKAIFEEFQDQYIESLELLVNTTIEDGESLVYTISKYGMNKDRFVRREENGILACSCRLFEMRGILCSHAIKVLRDILQSMDLPSHYILKRWTRQARSECVKDMQGNVIKEDVRLQQAERYRSLCSLFRHISSRASENEETFKLTIKKANELNKMVEDRLSSRLNGQVHNINALSSATVMCEESMGGNMVQAKGIKKKECGPKGRRRIKSSLEKALAKKKRKISAQRHEVEDIVYTPMPPPQTSQECDIPWMANTGFPGENYNFQNLFQQQSIDLNLFDHDIY